MNRNVWMLFFCQALINASGIAQVSMSSLVGYALAANRARGWMRSARAMGLVRRATAGITAGVAVAIVTR